MVGANCEWPAPKIRSPMMDCFDKANQFSFIGRQFGMLRSHRPPKESKSTVTLMKNSTKPGAGRITVNHKFLGKIRQLQQWRKHECSFKIQKSPLSILGESKIGEAKLDELIESTRGTIYRQGNPRDGL